MIFPKDYMVHHSVKTSVYNVATSESNTEPALEGVWKFPAVPDNISLNSYEDDTDVDSTLGTPLPESDMAFFDPLRRGDEGGVSQSAVGLGEEGAMGVGPLHTSKSWILEAVHTCNGE